MWSGKACGGFLYCAFLLSLRPGALAERAAADPKAAANLKWFTVGKANDGAAPAGGSAVAVDEQIARAIETRVAVGPHTDLTAEKKILDETKSLNAQKATEINVIKAKLEADKEKLSEMETKKIGFTPKTNADVNKKIGFTPKTTARHKNERRKVEAKTKADKAAAEAKVAKIAAAEKAAPDVHTVPAKQAKVHIDAVAYRIRRLE